MYQLGSQECAITSNLITVFSDHEPGIVLSTQEAGTETALPGQQRVAVRCASEFRDESSPRPICHVLEGPGWRGPFWSE